MRRVRAALVCGVLLLTSVVAYAQFHPGLAWNQWVYYTDCTFTTAVGSYTIDCDDNVYEYGVTTDFRTYERNVCPEYGNGSNFWCQQYSQTYGWQSIPCPAGFP